MFHLERDHFLVILTHALHEVVLEAIVCIAVLTGFRNRMERISFESLKARNHFAVGCRMGTITSGRSSTGQCDWLAANTPSSACLGGDISNHFIPLSYIFIEVFVWGHMLTIFNPDSTK